MEEENKKVKSDAALREEAVLKFWKENEIFEKSLAKDAPKGNYVFYDGPPFATGLMHYGHILGSTAKDVVGRYQTMQGYHVPRKWGWDCHGLPIENIVEKDLNIAGHKEIEKYGIDKFVEHARSKVLEYDKDWEKSVERIGRWVDFKGGYKTMDNTFIESVWWAFGQLNKKGLIYEGVRVLAYCARCETPIANSEIAMDNSYKDIADISVYVKFELEDEPGTYLIAWTTTPWTLPGNTALAINKNVTYVKIKIGDERYILAKETLKKVLKDKEYSTSEEINAGTLVGKKYKPVFPYYKNVDMPNRNNIWKIWHADFVTTEQGTGIVHEAPAFGEDDMNLAKVHNIPWIIHVDETGRFKPEVLDFAGLKVKPKDTLEDKDAHLRNDIEVIKYLQKTGAYFDKEKIVHSYPHCMRCDTPIIYYALPSWFINIQKVKKQIIEKADAMHWVPSHLKEGRFKNIVENAPDWNVSRNRYWASPLPVWKCEECTEKVFISSLSDLKAKVKKSGNTYFVMRHGEAENNAMNIYSSNQNIHHVTEKGKEQIRHTLKSLDSKRITVMYCSPFLRTRETAEMVAKHIGFPIEKIIYDDRIRELDFGEFSMRPTTDYWEYARDKKVDFNERIPGGESYQDAKNRIGEFLYEIDGKHKNESILIISHGLSVEIVPTIIEGADGERSLAMFNSQLENKPASLHKEHEFIPLPHNAKYELDFHRPYIDNIKLLCTCGGKMTRVLEVLDSWLESGSMPFAQDHFPFENPGWQKNNFPAGFVAEYIAQTRTWFYYTHVVSTILFDHAPFNNVVTTGTLLAEDGQKISKSKKNYPDPWIFIDKYGVDSLRIYLMASPLMKGEDANFSEKLVQEIASKIIGRLGNVVSFYELYRDVSLESKVSNPQSAHILNQWILARLRYLITEITEGLEAYDMNEASRPIENFVEDLSVWYLRRSRERIKEGNQDAKQTLYFVLKTLAKLLAPFAPFTAEDVWLKLKNADDVESVHLAEWPTVPRNTWDALLRTSARALEAMQVTRELCTGANALRQKAGIPVRQPLAELRIKKADVRAEYLDIIKDELNVKAIIIDKNFAEAITLDTHITPALKAEGEYREFMRELQDERKKRGLNPGDKMALPITSVYKKYKIMPNLADHMFRVAAVASLICDNFIEPLDKEDIVTAGLLHDMANIVKFDLNKFPEFNKPEGLEYWQSVRHEFLEKYGADDHRANVALAKEIEVSARIVELIESISFFGPSDNINTNDFAKKIVEYADCRVAPFGVRSLEERMMDLRKRYTYHADNESLREAFETAARGIEKQIFAKCKIKPEDINDATTAPIISELKKFVIK